ncbi:cation channel sperm-associated protein 3 [Ahaetulla prasina]|uniref:cation channel sperm-associated protein 3 n=1 Tax=Ahaetulla prasina TaxID=499056 RepID=UPI0026472520|nr:cation channel sperm-associated protein 3 [Ahaetulla prasina]
MIGTFNVFSTKPGVSKWWPTGHAHCCFGEGEKIHDTSHDNVTPHTPKLSRSKLSKAQAADFRFCICYSKIVRSQSQRGHIGTFILQVYNAGCEKISTVHILGSMTTDSVDLPEKSRLIEKLSFEAFKSGSEIEVSRYVFGYRRRDHDLYKFVENVFYHPLFKSVMISSIMLNAIFLSLETDYKVRYESHMFLQVADLIILAIYTTEFLMNLYLDPVNYWKDGYKRFDASVLFLAYLPYTIDHSNPERHHVLTMLKGFQALRVLKLLYYSPGITNLMEAMGQTVKNVIYVLVLLFLLIFIFAILGHGLYGDPQQGDPQNWGSLADAFFTLFSLVTVDGWTDLQDELDNKKFVTSRTFTIVFILLGFFVFFNMFIGVVIMDIQNSTEQYEQKLQEERQVTLIAKKQAILKRQQEEIFELFNLQKSTEYKTFDEMVESFKKSLLHSDPMILEDFCASLPFIDLYLASLDRQDATVYKLQDLYYEMVAILTTLLYHSQEKCLHSLQCFRGRSK